MRSTAGSYFAEFSTVSGQSDDNCLLSSHRLTKQCWRSRQTTTAPTLSSFVAADFWTDADIDGLHPFIVTRRHHKIETAISEDLIAPQVTPGEITQFTHIFVVQGEESVLRDSTTSEPLVATAHLCASPRTSRARNSESLTPTSVVP